jgi:DNA-binding protein YbaB
MFDKMREAIKFQKVQAEMQKQLEKIFASGSKGRFEVVVRGDRRVEKIIIDGEEQKDLKNLINDVQHDASKKAEKQMRGKLGDLGLPGF